MTKKARTAKIQMQIKEHEFAEQTIVIQVMLAVLCEKLDDYFKLIDEITEPGEEDYAENIKKSLMPIREVEAALNKLVGEA